jgi:hypothetical protein
MPDTIDSLNEPIIQEYFERLNAGEFTAASALFSEHGFLMPPFEESIQGRSAIACYLENEAKGMKIYPEQVEIIKFENRNQYRIQGKVETSWFTVKANWSISLNSAKEIQYIEVTLLDALTDLLNFKTASSLNS